MVKGADVDNVDFRRTPSLRNTRFTEFLIRKNALHENGFKGWVFCPGMLFNSTDKWWGDQGKRNTPHEGLDLCLYKDRKDTILRLGEKAKVPVIYDGIVVGIVDDFLGKSVIIEHLFSDCDNNKLCTIYGHTIPEDNLHVGKIVKAGEVIATLADSSMSKTNIFPHLHISLGWTSKEISYDRLDWENIGAPNTVTLLDPLQVIDWHYNILTREKCEKSEPAATAKFIWP
jgi:Peptidase family M23